MPKSSRQKLKLLYLAKILAEQSDESHPLTISDFVTLLGKYGISAERKSIYDDMAALRAFGLDIVVQKTRRNAYYLGERDFSLSDLILLTNLVQSSSFISPSKSGELIRKITSLASTHRTPLWKHSVYAPPYNKEASENIFPHITLLQTAFSRNKKVEYRYYDWVIDHTSSRLFSRRWRQDGRHYRVSPWAILWDHEWFTLLSYDDSIGQFLQHRIDKMVGLEILTDERQGYKKFSSLRLSQHSKKPFGSIEEEETLVRMKFANHLIGSVLDRFGKDIIILKSGRDHFTFSAKLAVDTPFFTWLFSLGPAVEILSPPEVVDTFEKALSVIQRQYTKYKPPPSR